jgi:1-phosphatidylinositol-4-phosphate 5-kinase
LPRFFFNHFLFICFRTGGIPARTADGQKLLLYVGIIDILQSYHIRKKLEHTFKSVLTDGVSDKKNKMTFFIHIL